MADINVTMGADDREFKGAINAATQAINKFSQDTSKALEGIQGNLSRVDSSVKGLGYSFDSIAAKIVGAFSIGALANLTEWANNISSTGKAVNMTSAEIMTLQNAVMAAGGTALAASRGIEMFYMKLDQARQGGFEQQVAFERLGITLHDLKNLDDRDLFKLTLDRLAQMPASAERNRIEVELLSKSFRGIPIQDIVANLDKATGSMDGFNKVIDDAAKAQQKFQQDLMVVKTAALEVAQPMLQAFTQLTPTVQEAAAAIRILVSLIAAWIAYNFAAKVIAYAEAFVGLARSIGGAITALRAFTAAEVFAANATGIGAVVSLLAKAVVAVGTYLGVEKLLDEKMKDNTKTNQEAADAANEKVKADAKLASTGQQVINPADKLNAAIRAQTEAFKANIQQQIQDIGLKDASIGKGEIVKAQLEEEIKIRDEYNRKIQEMTVKLKEAEAAGPNHDVTSRTVGTLRQSIADLTAQRDKDAAAAGEAARKRQSALAVDQMELLLKEDQIKINKTLADIQTNIDELSMTNDEKKIANIQKQTDEYIKLAMEKRRAQLGTDISDEELRQDATIQKIIKGVQDKQRETVAATQREIAASRDWSTAWNQAFKQYGEDATNGATMAKKIFDDSTKGMEDAIVNFAKTGKLSFADLINTIVEDLLRSQIRQLMANMFGGGPSVGGGGNIFSAIGKMFGFAAGGDVAPNKPILVGEQGPEIFIPPSSGSIVPNGAVTSGGSTQVTYNIQAVDAPSFQALIAQDPAFLYTVTQAGSRMFPATAR